MSVSTALGGVSKSLRNLLLGEMDPRGHQIAAADKFEDPAGIIALADTIVVVDPRGLGGGGGLMRVNPETGLQTTLATGNKLGVPIGVAREATGNLVVLDSGPAGQANAGVIRVTPEGAQTLIASGITQAP